jgi:H+-transporting ATPase
MLEGDAQPLQELAGLTSEEAQRRLDQYGLNALPQAKQHRLIAFLGKFWAPVPWMLEATIVLELVLRKRFEALVISLLLVFNAGLSFFQESRTRNALALLRKRLIVQARVKRDRAWLTLPAEQLVPGDFVHIRMGDLVPADIRVTAGQILLDESALTGESLPIDCQSGACAHAGAVVKRGEASGEVVATGSRTSYGKTAELVRTAVTVSHLQSVIFSIVRYMVALDAVLVSVLLIYALAVHMSFADMLPFALILLVASVPVALPATFTLATALGAQELAARGVLATNLSAIEEAAAMDVLCSDKTGTITENRLTVGALQSYLPFTEQNLLYYAALASDAATQDPIDLAILSKAAQMPAYSHPERIRLIPFDPATKLAEAIFIEKARTIHAIKGAPQAVAARVLDGSNVEPDVQRLAAQGARVLAVAVGDRETMRIAGLLALEDPPRPDSKALIDKLKALGIRVLMVTGDGLATAQAIAARVGISGAVCSGPAMHNELARKLECNIFAGVYPEDKFQLVRALQQSGHVIGMTGDGVNDAPALKQAEVGIAVANGTDVAKAAASLVLTSPGLGDIVASVETSRRIYQRMLTYTLNKVIKTVEIGFFLSLGVLWTRQFIITPSLIVLLLFTNDFVTMSIATDHVSFSSTPDRWRIGRLMKVGLALGTMLLMLSMGLFAYGLNLLRLPLAELQTLVFITLVFTGQGAIYLIRERHHFWHSAPSRWVILCSVADLAVVSFLAIRGFLMAPLPAAIVGLIALACVAYLIALDFLKVPLLRRFNYAA